ncbi:MAG TPA: amidohydrolase family protein [Gemmatimonadaceae bacterium]|nr:amidohydrolase family protein [Gemmatimonadaceae bacterium]
MRKLLLLAVLPSLFANVTHAQVTAIKAGRFFDAPAGVMRTNQVILVSAGRITAVGANVAIPKDATVIDLSRMTVLPGLLDMHTHLIGPENDPEPLDELRRTAAEEAYASIPNAKKVLLAGFTTVRDVGTYRALIDVAMRDAIARGIFPGPRMYVAGAYITITGGAGAVTGMSPDVILPWDMTFGISNSPWEVRANIRKLASNGADFIKVLSTGAVLTHGSNANAREFTDEELQAAVDEAHNFGFKIASHAHNAAGIKAAVRAGVNSIEHGSYLDEEGIQLMKQHGTYLVPTLETTDCIHADPNEPPDFIEHSNRVDSISIENFKRAVKEGVRVAFGTDISVCPFGTNAKEFALMVKYGMTPVAALQAATVGAADLLGHAELVGSIAPGKSADIIAVAGDPLADIRTMEDVKFVMKEGVVYKRP